MSSGRRSLRQSRGSLRISDEEILRLVSMLHRLLPRNRTSSTRTISKANRVIEETCEYITDLNREIDDLSARLCQLLRTVDEESPEAAIIRAFII